MKKVFFIFVVFVSLFFQSTIYAKSLTLGYVNFPPYEYIENDKPAGILVNIVQTIFKRADQSLTLKFFPFKRALSLAKNGKIDGLFNFYKNSERLKSFDYSEPIINNSLVFFVRKDSILNYSKLSDLKGLTIGVMRGYTYGPGFDNNPDFKREETNTHESNLKKLMIGRIDAYPCDKMVGIFSAMKEKVMGELKILPNPLKIMFGHIGFTKGKHKDAIEKINKEIKAIKNSGEIDKLIDDYIQNLNF